MTKEIKLDGHELWEIVFGVADPAAGEITDEQYSEIAKAINTIFIDPIRGPGAYMIGDETMRKVFEANGIKNVSDMQKVFDAVEKALTRRGAPEDTRLPRLENCGTYLAKDNRDQWHYLNHAHTWQAYQGPSVAPGLEPPVTPIGGETGPLFVDEPVEDCSHISDDMLWKVLADGKATAEDQRYAAGWIAKLTKKPLPEHDLYKTGDSDAPDCIQDRNGEVVLGLCRKCNRGEIELSEPCIPKESADGSLVSKQS